MMNFELKFRLEHSIFIIHNSGIRGRKEGRQNKKGLKGSNDLAPCALCLMPLGNRRKDTNYELGLFRGTINYEYHCMR
jgi:hypothetical protein